MKFMWEICEEIPREFMFEFHVELMQNKINFTLLVRNSGDVSLTELGKAFVNNLHKKIQDREKLVQVDRN